MPHRTPTGCCDTPEMTCVSFSCSSAPAITGEYWVWNEIWNREKPSFFAAGLFKSEEELRRPVRAAARLHHGAVFGRTPEAENGDDQAGDGKRPAIGCCSQIEKWNDNHPQTQNAVDPLLPHKKVGERYIPRRKPARFLTRNMPSPFSSLL